MSYNEDDRRREMRDYEDSREWDDLIETVVKFVLGAFVIVAVVFFAASWADGQFGWNLTGWLKGFFSDLMASFKS